MLELGVSPGSLHASIEGSMLSADISGFTSLSERQSGKGKAGAEELAEIISSCFSDLIDAAYAFDGEIIKFGGDALLVLFRGDAHPRRSAGAGLAMQRALLSSSAARRAKLTMTVGVAEGPFDTFLAGSGRRELLIIGGNADRVIQLESDAEKGETLVSPAIAEHFDPGDTVGGHHGGRVLRPDVVVAGRARHERAIPEQPLDDYVPGPVAAQLDAFAELGGEHRFATVGFLMVTGVAELMAADPQHAAREVGRVIDRVVAAGERFGVAPLETDIADDGFKFVLSAGAPLARGNTSDALLRTALDIMQLDSPLELRAGAQTGRVFAGFIGHPYRWTYTMMGDCMSTAARMLGRARDREIIAVADVIDDARSPFDTETLEPFRVKGKSAPITAHRVLAAGAGERRVDTITHRLFGREHDIDRARAAFAEGGSVVNIVGGAGSGKTAVLDRIIERVMADQPELRVVRVVAHQDGGIEPYADLRPAIRAMIAPDSDLHVPLSLAEIVDRSAPSLAGLTPLIADVVGETVESTPEADAIGADFRRARSIDAVVQLLEATPTSANTLLVIDDAQWLDESSADLAHSLVDRASAGRTLMASRSGGAWTDSVGVIELDPLPDDTLRRLAIERSERDLSNTELAAVVSRAQGNPLFAIELVRSLETAAGGALPDSIEKLITTRVDSLDPAARRVVRVAAVIGREFDSETLAALLGATSIGEVRRTLTTDLVDMISPTDDRRWSFTQAIHRDVAYEGLPFRERRRLHAAVGQRIEAAIGAEVESHASTLSLHWSEAHEHERAWAFSIMAGDRAMRLSSPSDALVAYERALQSARHTRSITRRVRSRVATKLGDAAEIAGRYDVARTAYDSARKLLPKDDPDHVPLFRKTGVVHEREGQYDRALRWYRRGLTAADDLDHAEPDEHVELSVAIAGIRFRQGRYEECRAAALPVADELTAPPVARLRACYVIQIASQYLGDRDLRDRYGRLGTRLADIVDEPVLEANLYNNLGISAYYEGDWDRAAELYSTSLELRDAAGDLIGSVTSLNNIGELRSDQYRLVEAGELFDEALRRASAAGYQMAVHVVRANLGRLATREGRRDDARRILLDALTEFEAIDAVGFVLETRLRLIEADGAQQVDDLAIRELLDDNDRLDGGATVEVPARRLFASMLHARNDHDGALRQLEAAMNVARRERLEVDLAHCLDELALLDVDEHQRVAAREESQAIRRRLGVVTP